MKMLHDLMTVLKHRFREFQVLLFPCLYSIRVGADLQEEVQPGVRFRAVRILNNYTLSPDDIRLFAGRMKMKRRENIRNLKMPNKGTCNTAVAEL